MANGLASLARPATNAPLGSGLARMAGNTILLKKAYDQYAISAQESGEQPLPFDDWVKSQTNS